jgi:hypothetical protein
MTDNANDLDISLDRLKAMHEGHWTQR